MMIDTLPPLALEVRVGMPAELAYLRATYPREKWREDINFGQLSAFWLDIHWSLREHGRLLGEATSAFRDGRWDAARFHSYFAPHLNGFLTSLDGHHQIEDEVYFPKFRALDGRMAAGFELLESDHERIHSSLLACAESGQALLASLGRGSDAARKAAGTHGAVAERLLALLGRHLADEEDLIVPAMLRHGQRAVS